MDYHAVKTILKEALLKLPTGPVKSIPKPSNLAAINSKLRAHATKKVGIHKGVMSGVRKFVASQRKDSGTSQIRGQLSGAAKALLKKK